MSYTEHAPPAGLAPWVECIWERYDDGIPIRVLPDGCIDVVWIQGAGAHFVGANSVAFMVALTPGAHAIGARMHPGAAAALLRDVVQPEALRDAEVGLGSLWPGDGERLDEALTAAVDPVAELRRGLLGQAARAAAPEALVSEAVRRLRASPAVRVVEVADGLGVSERQLRRRVRAGVGYGPKRLARVFRLQRALGAARAGEELAAAAFSAGYVDQAHFSGECRALAGVSPSGLLRAG